MNQVGAPTDWVGFIESRMPEILDLVVTVWESLPPPVGNEREDPVSENLCRALRQSRTGRNMPFQIHPQLVELDPAAGEDQGRMDIVFLPPAPREDIYFCLECKRLNVRDVVGGAPRPYFVEYVRFGMMRFIRGQYAKSVHFGGMLGFVLDGDVASAMAGVENNVQRMAADLGMGPAETFRPSTVRIDDPRVKETEHRRAGHTRPLFIHHLFLSGDPKAPLRPDPTPAEKPKSKAKARRKSTKGQPEAGTQ